MPEVRLLEERDTEAVYKLESLCFSEPWSKSSLGLLLEGDNFGVVATDGDSILAYGGMTCVLDEGAITNIATHPDARRRGFGRAVVRALLKEARKRGVRSVFLEVRESNEGAIALYRSEGFSNCGVRKNFYRKPTENAFQMICNLDQI